MRAKRADEGRRVPDDFQQPHDPLMRPTRRRDDPEGDTAHRPPPTPASEAPETALATNLGQFSLLADPTTISGEDENSSDESSHDEIIRLRSALYARSRELAALQRDPPRFRAPSSPSPDVEAPEPDRAEGQLLNSSQARKLAQEAHARERAIRAELSSARDALAIKPSDRPVTTTAPREAGKRWRTQPLVGSPREPEKGLPETPLETLPSAKPTTLLRAEIHELQATLSLARDTTRSQKKQIAELRIQLCARQAPGADLDAHASPAFEEPATTPEPLAPGEERSRPVFDNDVQIELTRLRDRLRHNEREFEARDAERHLLKQTLEERENDLAAQRIRFDALQDRFDAQSRALDDARGQFEQERKHHTDAQVLLARLRDALGDEPVPSLSGPVDVATTEHGFPAPSNPADPETTRSRSPDDRANDHTSPFLAVIEPSLFDDSITSNDSTALARPAIFDAWQDDQIRRHFGPMGIDTIIDLLRAPLTRRHDPDQSEMPLLLLGRGAWNWVATLAEGLIQNGTPPFTIYVCDPAGRAMANAERLGHESPIRAFLRDLPFPSDPARLRASLEAIEPVAVISRDFLSTEARVDPWLDVLASASTAGACLLFSERTGVGTVSTPSELSSVGNRIWELMPERYTRIGGNPEAIEASAGPTRFASWSEAFGWPQRLGEGAPANDLLARLRNRFRLEMLARFGFLAEAFVSTPIGANFDASAARDRKFLTQIADVDDRKIEAGIVPALHLVAVVDHEPDSSVGASAATEAEANTQG